MINVTEGTEVTWLVTSKAGRCIGSYSEERLAREHVERESGRGIPTRLFCREASTVELEHP